MQQQHLKALLFKFEHLFDGTLGNWKTDPESFAKPFQLAPFSVPKIPILPFLGNMNSLIGIFLGTNQFSGTIPSSLGNLYQLFSLDLGSNKVKGTIPQALGSLRSL
jgi:hypothetical protein